MKRSILAISVAVALSLTACSDDDAAGGGKDTTETTEATTTTEAAMTDAGNIVEVATEAGSFTTLLAAAKAAGLVDTLSSQELTVFAPTDEAFAAALKSLGLTADQLLADKEKLTAILTYHVVSGKVMAADVVGLNGQEVATVNGAKVKVTVDGETVMINNAKVVKADVTASNGVIHVIDSVLLPPS